MRKKHLLFRLVLNLIINGLPSISKKIFVLEKGNYSFKPYYKWITFNILLGSLGTVSMIGVLNLIINGLPSILLK